MCRLLGVVSATPISVSRAVGEDVLKDFVALTRIHGDGWGIARVRLPGHDPKIEVSAGSALDDPHFAAATHDQRSAASLVHLRWATTGIAVRPENSHPFLAERIAMAHNGSIKPIGQVDELLAPEIAATIRGTTDSELYFGLIRQHRASSPDLAEAVRRAVSQLREIFPTASLNAIVLGETGVLNNALRFEDRVVIASTGFGDLDWRPLESESVASISMHDLSMSTLPLMTPSTP